MSRTSGSKEPGVKLLAGACALGLMTQLAGCGGPDDQPPSNPPNPTPVPTTSATPAWESTYGKWELARYREAVLWVESFEAKSRPIWAQGRATASAKELFQDTLLAWQPIWSQLKTYDKQGIRIARGPTVLTTVADSIKILEDGGAEVLLSRCTDQTDLGGSQNGQPVPEAYDRPVIQKVDVYRLANGHWRIGVFKTTDTTCSA